MVIQGVAYLSDFEAKKAVIEAARRLESRGFLPAGDGSLSVRVGPNAAWVTVDGADKAALTQDMLVRLDLNGRGNLSARPKPLGEDLPIHLRIYRENENVQCVLHAYPPCAAALDRSLPAANYSPCVRRLGRLERLSGLSGEDLARAAALRSRSDSGVLLEGDGCLFWAKTPAEVCRLAEALHYRWMVEDALRREARSRCEQHGWTGARDANQEARSGWVCVPSQMVPNRSPAQRVRLGKEEEGRGRISGDSRMELSGVSSDAAVRREQAERDNNCGVIAQTAPAPIQPALPLTGVTGLIRPGQPLPPLPRKQEEPAVQAPSPAPASSAPLPADSLKAGAMDEVVRRVLQNL